MLTLDAFDREFPTDEACKQFLVEMRWPDGVTCVRCGRKEKVYGLKARPFHWVCCNPDCGKRAGYRFSILTRTIFENTKVPMRIWFKIAFMLLASKKGMSALQIHRMIYGEDSTHAYHTTWYIVMRWRAAMRGSVLPSLGSDGTVVEVDETFVGGKQKNRHWKDRQKYLGTGGEVTGKTPVIGAIARKGNVICKAVDGLGFGQQQEFVKQAVSTKARMLVTDEHVGYHRLGKDGYEHEVIKHASRQYVVGTVHTNTIESFWSLLKRGIMGSYHHVSDAYLPLYLNEFSWRFNNRKNPAIFADLIQGVSQ